MAEPTFIESMVNASQVASSLHSQLNYSQMQFLKDFILKGQMPSDKDWTEYDKQVQNTLDEYWPGTTELSAIKRLEVPVKCVYTAQYQGNEVIVKSVDWSAELEQTTKEYGQFIDYVGEVISVANYIDPDIEHSDDFHDLVTMSKFAEGVKPQELSPNDYAWIENEAIVRTEAAWWRDFRGRSIEFKTAYPETYATYPEWNTFQDGWETQFTTPTIPITETSYGVVHGDAHNGNIMIKDNGDGTYTQTTIDFDNMQKAWYVTDIGTVIWNANMEMWMDENANREEIIARMKLWFLDEYGWDTTEAELQQGCQWRYDFMYYLVKMILEPMGPWDPAGAPLRYYIRMCNEGKVPTC